MCIHFLSYSFHLHACSFHFALISFHVLSFPYGTGSMAWPGAQVQQMVIAKLSLSLSLNNPSNIWHCSKEICHKPTEREGERERETERERERKREPERASWMPNDMVTAGNRAPQVEFPSSVLPVVCTTVFAWYTPSFMDCRVWSQVTFGGALSLYSVRAHFWQKTIKKLHTKVVFKHFDRDSYVLYIYIIYYHITNIIFPLNCHEKSHVAQSMALIKPFTVLVAPSTCPIFARWRETHFPHGMGCYDGDMMEILL
jgi:hypothetical protein